MKQNERLLVYAVTGFLAVILVIAVLFGSDPKGDPGDGTPQGLEAILGEGSPGATDRASGGGPVGGDPGADGANGAGEGGGTSATRSGLAEPGSVTQEQPLNAKPQLASDLVARALGASRSDRNVRFVRAKRGDSLESLVRRWCGARDPYLEEARRLNEELVVVKIGQEVAVPWIDDEQLVARLEAEQPRMLLSNAGVIPGDGAAAVPASSFGAGRGNGGVPSNGIGPGPDFRLPGSGGAAAPAGPNAGGPNAGVPSAGGLAAVASTHTVVAGDALWTIVANKYGARNAPRMIKEVQRLNPGLDADRLKIGQKIKLPPPSE